MTNLADVHVVSKEQGVGDAFAPLAVWLAASIGLLAVAGFGPKLYASHSVGNATIAVQIVAAGQLLIAAMCWPAWTRSAFTAIAVVASAPAWLWLAGQLAQLPNAEVFAIAWKVTVSLGLAATIRAVTPEPAMGFVWALVMAVVMGLPSLLYLRRDF